MTDKEVMKLAQKLITDFKCESDTMVDFCNTVIKKYEQTSWIPVSERLPEEGEPILFSTKTGGVYEGAYFDLIDNRQWYAYKDENYAWNNIVTAWMPLPQPYTESEERDEMSLSNESNP